MAPLIDPEAHAHLEKLWGQKQNEGGVAEAVSDVLREGILDKILEPGQRLREEDVAEWFGVSRTPVREAVLRLEAEDLVDRRAGRGFVVGDITPREVIEVYVVREALDSCAANLAAHVITPPEVSEMRWLNEQMKTASDARDFHSMAKTNIEFHRCLASAARNSFLVALTDQVHSRVRRFTGTTFSHGDRATEALDEHEALIEALDAGDGALASQLARDHMYRARLARVEMLSE